MLCQRDHNIPRNFHIQVDCGGVYPDSRIMLEKALESMFDKVSNTHLWSEVGVVPFTQKCQTNKKVCHDGTNKDYPDFDILQDSSPRMTLAPPSSTSCAARVMR